MFKHQMPVCLSHWKHPGNMQIMRFGECGVFCAKWNWKIIGEAVPDMLCVEKIGKQRAKNDNIQRAEHQNPDQKTSPRTVGRKEKLTTL